MPTIIFKATEACNSNCVYCDVVHRKKPRTISFNLLEIAYKRINEYLLEYKNEDIQIIWHGGEPCMAGLKLYEEALRLQELHCPQTKGRISYAVQSNLTIINQDFIDVFGRMGIKNFGTSYEPMPNIRGLGKNRNSRLYNEKFFEGINLLEKNGISWGFIYVVTRAVLDKPLEILYHLSNLRLRGDFNIHPVLVYNQAFDEANDVAITQDEFADFLGTVFKEWWNHRDRYPDIEPFKSYLEYYTTNSHSMTCADAPNCGKHLYIGPDGETSQCGRASDWGLLQYGNIENKTLSEIFVDKQRCELDERYKKLYEADCKGCEYWRICHGGCPLDAYNAHNEFTRKTDQCVSKKKFLKEYFEPITGLKFNKYEL